MKVYNEITDNKLDKTLSDALIDFRKIRNFDVDLYVQTKAKLLNDYLRKSKLSSCVVAVSGGIDSSIVLGMVSVASKMENSPIKRIVPLMLPVFNSKATTNQDSATNRAVELVECLGLKGHIIDLSKIHPQLKDEVDSKIGIKGDDWAAGQLVAYLRTPAIYYTTSLMSQDGTPGVVIGTTNRDEGSYLGYVGKASDGMVDVQLISDLHKSEVYKIAHHLKLPQSILDVIPTGDMYDGRVDTEVFGASYDFVELYLNYLCLSDESKQRMLSKLSDEGKKQFNFYAEHLENLHRYNKHKYLIGSPAVHLDIYKSDVPGGWSIQNDSTMDSKLDFSKINGYFEIDKTTTREFIAKEASEIVIESVPGITETQNVYQVKHLLSDAQCDILINSLKEDNWISVSADGYKNSKVGEITNKGSERQTIFNRELADHIWSRLSRVLPEVKNIDDKEMADADGCSVWRPIGISPLFRFIRYKKGNLLIPHYDGPFKYDNKTATLISLVMYLTNHKDEGGETRFLKDPQTSKPSEERDYSDWHRLATEEEIAFKNTPHKGDALLMDHRILHDSAEFTGDAYKLIIRTDVVYTKCIRY